MIERIQREIRDKADPIRAEHLQRFFKTGPGEYGEGDKFLGNRVPDLRVIAKKYKELQLDDVINLLHSEWHEDRLTALIILTIQFKEGNDQHKKRIYDLYLKNTRYINNWDLVDTSAHKIVGPYLVDKPNKMKVLSSLAESNLLWERRIAMVSTLYNIGVKGSADEAIILAEQLLNDKEDLMHKAVGWCLRELGKRVDEKILLDFLDKHVYEMPRTMLRYSIERLDEPTRKYYLSLK